MSPRHAQLEMEPVYGFFYGICRMAHQMFFRGDAAGLENLPESGGYIVAANHASLLDPRSSASSCRARSTSSPERRCGSPAWPHGGWTPFGRSPSTGTAA